MDLFSVSWFAYAARYRAFAAMLGQSSSANGWNSFDVIGPLTLIVCLAGVAVTWFTAVRPSPALPVVLSTLLLPVSLALSILVAVRVLLAEPSVHLVQAGGANVIVTQSGAYVGLALSVLVVTACFLSMRRDPVTPQDSAMPIETIRLAD